MRIGFIVNKNIGGLEKVFQWTSSLGFQAIEVSAAEGGIADPARTQPSTLATLSKKYDLKVVLDYFGNLLDQNPEKAASAANGLRKALDLASESGIEVVVGSCGKFSSKLDENLKRYAEVYPEIADYASSRGVKIAFEIWPGFNFAYTPDRWKMIFDAVPSRALGLNFDPSHLVWQFVDYLTAARNFADRIYSFHAKDTEIISSRLSEVGITGDGWWRFRIPGWGSVNWSALISVLIERKYPGIISVEHEDPLFDYEEGLRRGLAFLKNMV
ncbi:MAG: sugar phosphate isomerase/epimerase family protein [Thermoprotei archaeon]